MRGVSFFYFYWIGACLSIAGITWYYNQQATNFFGIAETKEVIVSIENAADLQTLHVNEGQVVRSGDILLELDRPELSNQIMQIKATLVQIKAQKGVSRSQLRAQILQLEA